MIAQGQIHYKEHKMPEETIAPIPRPIPPEIITAINNKKLAVFIGAGVSRLAGCIGWDRLAADLVKCCHKEGIINYKVKTKLTESDDHKKTITICYHLLDNKGRKATFFKQMKHRLTRKIQKKSVLIRSIRQYLISGGTRKSENQLFQAVHHKCGCYI